VRSGGSKSETIRGTSSSDRLSGGGGNDRLLGGRGNDRLAGGRGNDGLSGGPGRDRLDGGPGRDRLSGGSGSDRLSGGSRGDRLNGGPGVDRLWGGPGRDRLDCGSGEDKAFRSPDDVVDPNCEHVRGVLSTGQIAQNIADAVRNRGIKNIRVKCPPEVINEKGSRFSCTVTNLDNGRHIQVVARQTDDAGNFDLKVG
jgi:Ca2+-binding RTX toxin-like protein